MKVHMWYDMSFSLDHIKNVTDLLDLDCVHVLHTPTVKLKPKGDRPDTIMHIFNTTFYRLMQTAAAKHINVGVQCRLKSSHIGLPLACVCEADRDISPSTNCLVCDSTFCKFSVGRYSLYKRVRRGAEKEMEIRVRIISTGAEKRE